MNVLLHAFRRHGNWGVYTIFLSTYEKSVDGDICPPLQLLHWLYVKRTQLTLTRSTPCCSLRQSSCWIINVTSAGCWVTVCGIQHILPIPHITSSTASKRMRHDDCFSHIMMHSFKYTSVRLSPIRKSTLTFPQCSETICIAKTTNKMRIFIVATVIIGNIIRVWQITFNYLYFNSQREAPVKRSQ
jgi:hypothetical protein